MQVTNTVLEPGQYVFKLLNSSSDRHIVQIFNSDQSRIVDTVLAIPNYRLQPTGDSRFAMWETPPGHVQALRAWFYPGDNFGQEFRYPKQLRQIALAVAPPESFHQSEAVPEPTAAVEEPVPAPEAVAEEAPAPAPEPAPAPAPEAAAPAPEPTPQSAELPHTGSYYPIVGLFGILSVALFALLRLKRSA